MKGHALEKTKSQPVKTKGKVRQKDLRDSQTKKKEEKD